MTLPESRQVLITGGSSGIGLATAKRFAACADNVFVTHLPDANPKEQLPTHVEPIPLDVTDEASVSGLSNRFQSLDCLVNCAGVILRDQREFSVEEFRSVIDVNLIGTMSMCTTMKGALQNAHGSIVNMASMLTIFGSPVAPAYSSSKGGVAQLTKSLAIAWANDNIRVNAVAPGWIKTEMTKPLYQDMDRNEQILRRTPLHRWGTPEEVADVIFFLCSPAASFMTGAIVPVDGGYSIS